MDNGIVVIGDHDLLLGLKLAGISKSFLFEEDKIEEIIDKVKEEKLIIVTEDVAGIIRTKNLDRKLSGVLIDIPNKEGSQGYALKQISKLFEEAIGIKVKK